MALNIPAEKPKIRIDQLSHSPCKSYLFSLLCRDIRDAGPVRALDAGAGELRNYWMFPGHYVGITISEKEYFAGVRRWADTGLFPATFRPEVYLMRLERDFAFLGLFQLVVCTNTIKYVTNPCDAIARLAERVAQHGSLLLSGPIEYLAPVVPILEPEFGKLDLVYLGYREAADKGQTLDDQTRALLSRMDMMAPNTPEGHRQFYLKASNKLGSSQRAIDPPKVTIRDGLSIVEDAL
jgi:hypothetical protein